MGDHELGQDLLPGANPAVHMVAGSLSGVFEHVLMYPLDCIKTRLQCIKSDCTRSYTGVYNAFTNMLNKEGIRSFYRGVPAVVSGACPAHAVYFSLYEFSKNKMSSLANVSPDSSPIIHGASGMIATFGHDSIMTPSEVVKQRLQVGDKRYTGVIDCARKVLMKEGVTAFYRSFPAQLLTNIPYHSINFAVYERCRKSLIGYETYDIQTHLASGAMAGALASALTTPLDMIKTTLNVQDPDLCKRAVINSELASCGCEGESIQLRGIRKAIETIYRFGGLPAFFRGVIPRVAFNTPSCAICWGTYETFKFVLSDTVQ